MKNREADHRPEYLVPQRGAENQGTCGKYCPVENTSQPAPDFELIDRVRLEREIGKEVSENKAMNQKQTVTSCRRIDYGL